MCILRIAKVEYLLAVDKKIRRNILFSKLKSQIFILNYLGALLTVFGVLLLLPFIPAVFFHELARDHYEITTFLLPSLISIATGILLQRGIPKRAPSVQEGMVITALAWIVISIVGSLPFIFGLDKSFVDAVFETASGLTTTGITVFEGLDSMPMAILFWRALIQWIGGLGILTFFLAVAFRGGGASATLFGSEGHKIAAPRPVPGIYNTLKVLWSIYIFFTVVSIILLWAEGMTFFDALTHSLTAISTGGFSTHDASIGFFSGFKHGILIEYTIIFFMLMGGINFLIHFQVFNGHFMAPFRDFEMKWFWGVLIGSTFFIMLDHFAHFPISMADFSNHFAQSLKKINDVFRISFFQVASMITSTGFATKDINAAFFPALAKQIFMFLMFVGGCVGSTAGGIKLLRLGIMVKTLKTELMRLVLPARAVLPVVVQKKVISDQQIRLICSLLCAWTILIFAGAGITAFFSDLNAWQSLSGMLSAMGNMGPFYFSVHKMASLHPLIKWTYTFGMIAGRLEILPLIVLIFPMSWKQ